LKIRERKRDREGGEEDVRIKPPERKNGRPAPRDRETTHTETEGESEAIFKR